MKRRNVFSMTALAVTGLNLASCMDTSEAETAACTQVMSDELPKHVGAVTLYYEFRIAGPENANMLTAIDALTNKLSGQAGYLSVTV